MTKSYPKSEYSKKLLDPRWQKKRLEILQRDQFTCQSCFDSESTLHVHHCYYSTGKEPWDYPDISLVTLCSACHEIETSELSGAKSDLITVLSQRGLLSKDYNNLTDGLIKFDIKCNEVAFTVINWVFSNKDIYLELESKYFQFLSKKDKK